MSELAVIEQQPQQGIDVGRWAETLVFAAQLAEKVHDTEFVPKQLRGRPEAVAATIMYGAEVGVTPMQALAGIHIVEGRPAPSAELMRAMILRAGHAFTVHEMSGTRARVSGLRRGQPETARVAVEWNLDMARAAGLLNKTNWRNYPRAMLLARATGDLARLVFADVVKGLGYVAEDSSVTELSGWAPDVTDGPAPAPKKRALQRRKPAPAPESVADDVSVDDSAPAAGGGPAAGAPERTVPPYAGYEPEDEPMPDELQPHGTGRPVRPQVDLDLPEPPEPPVLPDVEPEQTADEAPLVGPKMIGPGQLKAVQACLTAELGTVATREEKHAMLTAILGRPITTTKELTRDEAFAVLAVMARFADGKARWQADLMTGAITVTDEPNPARQELERVTGGPDA